VLKYKLTVIDPLATVERFNAVFEFLVVEIVNVVELTTF
jgi:hypothetical protein